jgi:hypothetical protein
MPEHRINHTYERKTEFRISKGFTGLIVLQMLQNDFAIKFNGTFGHIKHLGIFVGFT